MNLLCALSLLSKPGCVALSYRCSSSRHRHRKSHNCRRHRRRRSALRCGRSCSLQTGRSYYPQSGRSRCSQSGPEVDPEERDHHHVNQGNPRDEKDHEDHRGRREEDHQRQDEEDHRAQEDDQRAHEEDQRGQGAEAEGQTRARRLTRLPRHRTLHSRPGQSVSSSTLCTGSMRDDVVAVRFDPRSDRRWLR
jgi:hypothetical protein